MSAHSIDTEALRRDARRVISDPYGGALETWWASHALRALDALEAAEHRATQAETQSETRRLSILYWQEQAGAMKGSAGIGPGTKSHRARMRTDIRIYRSRNYPETEDQT